MSINTQPILENEEAILYPLQHKDFEDLYAIAADPKIWEQHTNHDRWKREVFKTFFALALQSKGAFKIVDKTSGACIGSTRIYNYKEQEKSVFVGYTFYAVSYWGKGVNRLVKATLLDYIFQSLSMVYFHIGANNIRSQIAIARIGAKKIAEEVVTYMDGTSRLNFLYAIRKDDWCNMEQ